MKRAPLYEVWSWGVDGLHPGPRFRLIADAQRYLENQPIGAPLGIRSPDGTWHTSPYSAGDDVETHVELPGVSSEVRRAARPLTGRARVLVVDDDAGSRNALAALLREEHYDVTTAIDGADALQRVAADPPDLVITDVMMPNTDGFELVEQLRERAALADMPIILVSALDDSTRRIGGLDLGADDYLPKPLDGDELLARVRVHLRHAHRSREVVARSGTDELTGVLNRRGIVGVLERERERARRDGTYLALFVIDVDDFKSINDEYGHAAGDEVLQTLADRIARAVRANDRVGRFGGDEFLIVAPNTGLAAAEVLRQRIKSTYRKPIEVGDGVMLQVTVSIGSTVDNGSEDTDELFNRADAAMYRRKRMRAAAQ